MPGEVVSVNQLSTGTPGYIAQMAEISTRCRYVGTTVYIDQSTKYLFVYLQSYLTADTTIKGKKLFK